jgi:hypothetical protein
MPNHTPSIHRSILHAVGCALALVTWQASAAATESDTQIWMAGENKTLQPWESDYLVHAVDRLYSHCQRSEVLRRKTLPEAESGRLSVRYADNSTRVIQGLGGSSSPFSKVAIFADKDGQLVRYHDCNPAHVLPVTAIVESQQLDYTPEARRTVARLTSYEPNKVGWTFDDNDVNEGYLDAVFSVKYPFLHDGHYSSESALLNPFFAFSGRFSQYIESRDSSPVIGKRFNPKLFARHWLGSENNYIDFGYAHESNGQNISSEEAYLRERDDLAAEGEDPDFARDYISRGWDYLSVDWRHAWEDSRYGFTTYVMLKYFLDDGLLQGKPEEHNDWEGHGQNHRKEYDGLSLLAKYRFGNRFCLGGLGTRDARSGEPGFCLRKLAWQQTTGYDGLLENNTTRLELTLTLWDLPVMLWGQTGYNSDLVDYYKDVNSWGLSLELQSF